MTRDRQDDETVEEAQAAIREGIERAQELVCEAKLVIARQKPVKPRPFIPLR